MVPAMHTFDAGLNMYLLTSLGLNIAKHRFFHSDAVLQKLNLQKFPMEALTHFYKDGRPLPIKIKPDGSVPIDYGAEHQQFNS